MAAEFRLGILDLVAIVSEVDALAPLPQLDTSEEERREDEDNSPFPINWRVFEDYLVDDRDVDNWEDGDETGDDGPEEEWVSPDVDGPDSVWVSWFGLHAEERSSHVDHLPGEEQGEPSKTDECC